MKSIFPLLSRHIFIGTLITFIIFWTAGELPYFFEVRDKIWIGFALAIAVTLLIWVTSKKAQSLLIMKKINTYLFSFTFIFCTWSVLFFVTVICEAIKGFFENGRLEILEYFEGFIIYRLWFYWLLGFIHGIVGSIFLAIDLKKSLKVNSACLVLK